MATPKKQAKIIKAITIYGPIANVNIKAPNKSFHPSTGPETLLGTIHLRRQHVLGWESNQITVVAFQPVQLAQA